MISETPCVLALRSIVVLAIAALGAAVPAQARTIAIEGNAVVYHAASGEVNEPVLKRSRDGSAVVVVDNAVPPQGPGALAAGPGCRMDRVNEYSFYEVHCPLAGIATIKAELGDGDDALDVAADGLPPIDANGGAGRDSILTADAADTIDPGPGADAVAAGPGDDVVSARDGERDTVRCEQGQDTLVGDPDGGPLAGDEAIDCEQRRLALAGGEAATIGWGRQDRAGHVLQLWSLPGHADAVTVRASGAQIEITDAAGLLPLAPCRRPDPADRTRAVCLLGPTPQTPGSRVPARLAFLELQLGDGDDRLVATRTSSAGLRSDQLRVLGEGGDDRIDATGWAGDPFRSHARLGRIGTGAGLFGGAGRDTLLGSREAEVLAGGDGDDTLVPGAGVDLVDDDRSGRVAGGRDRIDLRDGDLDRYRCRPGDRVTADAIDAADLDCGGRGIDTHPRGRTDAHVPHGIRLRGRIRHGEPLATVPITCPRTAPGGCFGSLMVPGSSTDLAPFALRPGSRATIQLPVVFVPDWLHRLTIVTRDGTGRTSTRTAVVTYPQL